MCINHQYIVIFYKFEWGIGGSWAVLLLNHYPTPTYFSSYSSVIAVYSPPQVLLLVTACPAFHSQASWQVWPLPSVGSRTLSAASWETRHWRWERSMNQTGDHTALTLCELLVEHLMDMWWSCDNQMTHEMLTFTTVNQMTVVMMVMWQSNDCYSDCDNHVMVMWQTSNCCNVGHLTSMWWSCDTCMIIMWQSCDGHFHYIQMCLSEHSKVQPSQIWGWLHRAEGVDNRLFLRKAETASSQVSHMTDMWLHVLAIPLYQYETLTMWSCVDYAVHSICS